MLENNLKRQTTNRCKDLFLEVHHPLRNDYVFVEELVRENSHNKSGLFQPPSSFPLRKSFPRRGKITALTNFPLLTTTLGASQRRPTV
jgi:NADH:ubiquinone oxidoreductase subunit C